MRDEQIDEIPESPMELAARFERCPNYPRSPEGVIFFAQAIKGASDRSKIPMAEIVQTCLELSPHCPTDSELLAVALNMRTARLADAEAKRDREKEWQRQYGKPDPLDWRSAARQIMAEARLQYWPKDAAVIRRCKGICQSREIQTHKLSHSQFFKLQVWAREQEGLPVTVAMKSELERVGGQDFWWQEGA